MSNDAVILLPILLATIVTLVVIRHTFRSATSVYDAAISPLIFAVIGGLIGISIGMIAFSDRDGRVVIDKGVPILLSGITIGALAGMGLRSAYSRLNQGKIVVLILVMMLLGASIGAPIGWITGSVAGPHYNEQLCLSRMIWGIVIGSGAGLLMVLPQLFSRSSIAT